MSNYFEAGKTYIENAPYRAPEITAVFKVEWVGTFPDKPETHMAFGFSTPAYPGNEWQLQLQSASQEDIDKGDLPESWVEAVWTMTEEDGKVTGCWTAKP